MYSDSMFISCFLPFLTLNFRYYICTTFVQFSAVLNRSVIFFVSVPIVLCSPFFCMAFYDL